MSTRKSRSATASDSVAKKPRKSVTLEEKMEDITKVDGGQSRPVRTR
jgi:hypothetical protein